MSLAFSMLLWAGKEDSEILWYVGVGASGLSALYALVTLQRCWKYTTHVMLVLLGIYAGVYLVLSANGRYEPALLGANHVKFYSWAPAGFVYDNHWNTGTTAFFSPLWFLDVRLWHTHVRPGYSGPYPINVRD